MRAGGGVAGGHGYSKKDHEMEKKSLHNELKYFHQLLFQIFRRKEVQVLKTF